MRATLTIGLILSGLMSATGLAAAQGVAPAATTAPATTVPADPSATPAKENRELTKLVQQGKVHRMVIQSGSEVRYSYFPIGKLSGAELALVKANQPQLPDPNIRLAADGDDTALPTPRVAEAGMFPIGTRIQVTLRGILGRDERIVGFLVGSDADWMTIRTFNGLQRIRNSDIVRIGQAFQVPDNDFYIRGAGY